MTMNDFVLDAFVDADRLYAEYEKLARLGDLAVLGHSGAMKQEVVASVSPVMCENYQNGIVERASPGI